MEVLLELKNVVKVFTRVNFSFSKEKVVYALNDVSFSMDREPKVLALVGESGSGKTTISKLILGLEEPTSGEIIYKGIPLSRWLREDQKGYRREVQIIFQDPFETFNPFYRVDRVLWTVIQKFNLVRDNNEARRKIEESLEAVGLRAKEILGRYPHQLSGGERQRFMLARVYILRPKLLVADEPVSMLDASLRAVFLDHLKEFRKDGISCLYITHDLNTAYYISDYILIIYAGKILERGPVERIISNPLHPYTKMLIDSIPIPDPNKRWTDKVNIDITQLQKVSGREIMNGCVFYNRCNYSMERCKDNIPPMKRIGEQEVSCFLF
ncbi:MAG: ABC transporter ATP-binding protein [bacterium]